MPAKNLQQRKATVKRYYHKNKDKLIAANRARHDISLAFIHDLKRRTPCVDCKHFFHPVCMDFDHIDRTKKVNTVGRLVGGGASLDRVKEEVAKCEIVCSNCHRMRTMKQLEWNHENNE